MRAIVLIVIALASIANAMPVQSDKILTAPVVPSLAAEVDKLATKGAAPIANEDAVPSAGAEKTPLPFNVKGDSDVVIAPKPINAATPALPSKTEPSKVAVEETPDEDDDVENEDPADSVDIPPPPTTGNATEPKQATPVSPPSTGKPTQSPLPINNNPANNGTNTPPVVDSPATNSTNPVRPPNNGGSRPPTTGNQPAPGPITPPPSGARPAPGPSTQSPSSPSPAPPTASPSGGQNSPATPQVNTPAGTPSAPAGQPATGNTVRPGPADFTTKITSQSDAPVPSAPAANGQPKAPSPRPPASGQSDAAPENTTSGPAPWTWGVVGACVGLVVLGGVAYTAHKRRRSSTAVPIAALWRSEPWERRSSAPLPAVPVDDKTLRRSQVVGAMNAPVAESESDWTVVKPQHLSATYSDVTELLPSDSVSIRGRD